MAVTHLASSGGTGFAGSSTFSHTVPADANCLVVFLAPAGGLGTTTPTATYNGVSMTRVHMHSATGRQTTMFVLPNPPVGTANVFINWTTARSYVAGAASFGGVDTDDPVVDVQEAGATSASIAAAAASQEGDMAVMAFSQARTSGGAGSPVSPATSIYSNVQAGDFNMRGGGAYREAGAPDTSVGWSPGASGAWAAVALVLRGLSGGWWFWV